ncbi:protein kinase [Kribbella sp. NPDC051620]|uniref:protein kinase domain-containing protein n=1 Tax=Kribbella sp. NPDC051620 TaxID=3364120 RepID=UPI0037942FEA
MMRIGRYDLVTEFCNTGAGQCRWAFATCDGEDYFLKEFLRPTYPIVGGPGSAATRSRKLLECEEFEKRHRGMMRELKKLSVAGGNLIVAREFFRSGAKFYKVTEKINVSGVQTEEIHLIPFDNQVVLAVAVAHSVHVLHRINLVHGDLKPQNVLLKETVKGYQTAKLIDFDDSFRAGNPPPPDDLVGDVVYYSPETYSYVAEAVGSETLREPADVFALGILFGEYFTGRRPEVYDSTGRQFATCAAGVVEGGTVRTGLEVSRPDLDALLKDMLAKDPDARPDIGQVMHRLKEAKRNATHPASSVVTPGPRLNGSLLVPSSDRSSRVSGRPVDHPTGAPRLRGSLAPDRRGRIDGEA